MKTQEANAVNKSITQYQGRGGGGNVRHTVGTLEAILCRLKISFYS
jgi:hypothetical protein